MTIFDLEGRPVRTVNEQRPEDAAIADKVIGIYIRHNLGKLCECKGCEQVRILLLQNVEST